MRLLATQKPPTASLNDASACGFGRVYGSAERQALYMEDIACRCQRCIWCNCVDKFESPAARHHIARSGLTRVPIAGLSEEDRYAKRQIDRYKSESL